MEPALNVSHMKQGQSEKDQSEPVQMEAPSITEAKPIIIIDSDFSYFL
jgi:hypothetical protein